MTVDPPAPVAVVDVPVPAEANALAAATLAARPSSIGRHGYILLPSLSFVRTLGSDKPFKIRPAAQSAAYGSIRPCSGDNLIVYIGLAGLWTTYMDYCTNSSIDIMKRNKK